MPQAGDLDGLSTGDLSMVYPLHGRGNRAANRVIPFPGSILRFPRRGANQIVENRGTLIYGAETLFRIETVLRYEIKHRSPFLVP